MIFKATCRWLLICLVCVAGFTQSQIVGNKRIAAIRVAFQVDDSPGTTGDGQFLLTADSLICGSYTLDPPPHNRDYFRSQLKALNNYFTAVSRGQLTIDLVHSEVYPLMQDSVYTLPYTMDHYHPYGSDDAEYERLITELYRDAVQAAFDRDSIDFSLFDIIIVYHAGVGQDFALPFLDPTPEDIPSTFVDSEMIRAHLDVSTIVLGNAAISEGLILPETQNHLLFDEMINLFGSDFSSCDYQFALTGTTTLLTGFLLGFPPLWNTDSGESGIGVFGLMDQGSNNGRGVIPAPPEAWTRMYAGWESPVTIPVNSRFSAVKRPQGEAGKIVLGPNEYYLIENRSNIIHDGVSIDSLRYAIWEETNIYPPYVKVLLDSVPVTRDSNGVVVGVPNYDLGLPNSGLLIWHIDEDKIAAGIANHAVNIDKEHRGIDLVEADGAKDIGFQSIFPFNDPSAGYFADMWYRGNLEYLRFNPDYSGLKISFGPYTVPATRTFAGAASYIAIDSIGFAADTMSFFVRSSFLSPGFPQPDLAYRMSYDLDQDGIPEYIGGADSLWLASGSLENRIVIYPAVNPTEVIVVNTEQEPALGIVEQTGDSTVISVLLYRGGIVTTRWVYTRPSLFGTAVQGVREAEAIEIIFADAIHRFDGNSEEIRSVTSDISRTYLGYMTQTDGTIDSLKLVLDQDGTVSVNGLVIPEAGPARQTGILDLDLNGRLDVVVLNENDELYVFDEYGVKLSGFPVRLVPSVRWLSRQLFADDHPEIVVQDTAGDFRIFNWKGNLEYYIANPTGAALKQLAGYGGYYAIFTDDAVWQFEEESGLNGENSWNMISGSAVGDRTVKLVSNITDDSPGYLLDKSRTYVYPNPVTAGQTTFRITTGDVDYVECEIYDIAGYFTRSKRIETTHGQLPVEWTWNTTELEPGVYFARVKAVKGNRSEAKTIKIGIIK